VIGFHTQYYCNNFLETCNRYLEARIDLERFSVTQDQRETLVRAFPIGIDRLDYTKGLIERMNAVERFLEKYPDYIGNFSLLQIASPTRTTIETYQRFYQQLKLRIKQINTRFSISDQPNYQPILFFSTNIRTGRSFKHFISSVMFAWSPLFMME